jgi:hypothetical protein
MPADQVFYDLAKQRLESQMARIEALDDKAAKLFPFATGALPVFAAVLALYGRQLPLLTVVFIVLGVIMYLTLLLMLYRSIQSTYTWSYRPEMRDFEAKCAEHDDAEMRQWVASECLASLEVNGPWVAQKASHIFWAIVCLPLEAMFLTLAALSTLLNVNIVLR